MSVGIALSIIGATPAGAAPSASGAPDYEAQAQVPPDYQAATIAPDLVVIEGETVPVTLDLPWFLCIHSREASGWHNHIDGGLQIIGQTWRDQGGHEYAPHAGDATVLEQLDVGRRVLSSGGVRQWSTWRFCA